MIAQGDEDNESEALRAEAVALAGQCDHVVVFLGLPAEAESEGFDRTHINLPASQLRLVDALAELGKPIIVVLANGSVVQLSTWEHKVAAILECWLSGQAAGGAVVDLLLGKANPSGKLAETIPLRLEDNSSYLNFPGDPGVVRYGEGIFIGYRAYDRSDQPVSYPFGFGLSYTTFAISEVEVEVGGSVAGGDLTVEVTATVTNTGSVAGAEVVQVYVRDVESTVDRPVRELAGFTKVALEPGESQTVSIAVAERAFAFWSTQLSRWAIEAGDFEISVGSLLERSGGDEDGTLDAPSLALPLGPASTLHEWLADDRGRELLDGQEPTPTILRDPELIKVIGTMPMETLAAFRMGFDHDTLQRLVTEL